MKIVDKLKNKRKNKELEVKENGITLIALVITIIVLLILAAVSIATLTGENGILTRANDARTQTEEAKEDELRRLTALEAATNLEDTTYIDNSTEEEKTVTIPAETAVSQVEGENTLKDGLVIIDKNGNEWVWIEVPKSIYDNEEYYTNGATKPTNSEDYGNIEKILQAYTSTYRKTGYEDDWYEGCGLGLKEYTTLKQYMLKSIYENGGFFIGRYEVGIKENTARNYDDKNMEYPLNETPVIQQNKYIYNWIKCSQAQELSEELEIGKMESSLMFGIQWDLVLKYLETNGNWETTEEASYYLNTDSSSWGNYKNVSFTVEKGNKYMMYNNGVLEEWKDISENYTKISYDTSEECGMLLSTGASYRNSKMNICDLAGNAWEWTLEKSNTTGYLCTVRGGVFAYNGFDRPASYHVYSSISVSMFSYGFRPALY